LVVLFSLTKSFRLHDRRCSAQRLGNIAGCGVYHCNISTMNRVETLDVGDHEIDVPLMTEQRRMVV